MSDIMSFFPYEKSRQCQEDTLLMIEKNYNDYDCFVITAPTGSGKSGIGAAIQSCMIANGNSCAYITPSNVLRDQLLDDFDHMKTVKSQESYWLPQYNMTEKQFRQKIYRYGPRDSEYEKDRKVAKRMGTAVVANYHTFLAHKLQRQGLIVDEAHQLLHTLQDLHSRKIWRHMYGYPLFARTPSDVLKWIESKDNVTGLLRKLYNSIKSLSDGTILEMSRDYYRGEMCDCLKLLPLDVSGEAPIFWPNKTKKIFLMSATIGPEDIKAMGLGNRRVLYIDVDSPIPEERRPIRFVPVADMSKRVQDISIPNIVDALQSLASQNPEKGFVHATYDIARKLRMYLEDDPRFMFHNSDNKSDVYKEFLASEDKILVGSGMYEGISLDYDLATWQVLLKCPYPSLANPAYRYLATKKPDAYLWRVTKDILQASGRVCRGPDDYGITYLIDTSFEKWYNKALERKQIPKWFRMEEI